MILYPLTSTFSQDTTGCTQKSLREQKESWEFLPDISWKDWQNLIIYKKHLGKHMRAPDSAWVQGASWRPLGDSHNSCPCSVSCAHTRKELSAPRRGAMKHAYVSDHILSEEGHEMTPTEEKAGNTTRSSQSLTWHKAKDGCLWEMRKKSASPP